ncbi:hypothetical protein Rcae01_06756 [Novipirellula caenicola]|uniref:Uncharacterized protein n=1 Tax=Novipirellula caenicola TaxID=1536901 RepID=A0ABP9W355_9BACT
MRVVIGLTGRLSARLTLLGHGKQTRTMPVVVTQIAKTLAWIVAFGLLGLSLAPAIASAPQQHYELRYVVVGGVSGLLIGVFLHRPWITP